MEELRIKCPSCSIILDVRNSKNEAVKQIVCPNCKKNLAITFREEQGIFTPIGTLHYGEAVYPLKEGVNIVGRKDPTSKADLQIATGDPFLELEHARINVVRLSNGRIKTIISKSSAEASILIGKEHLQGDDEVVFNKGDEIQLGNTLLKYQ